MNKNQKKWLIISIVIIIILALGLGLGLGLGLKKKDTRDDFSEIFDSTKINIPLDKRCIDSSFKGTSDPNHEQAECSITFKIIPKCKNVLEIGGGLGKVSHFININLKNPYNHVVMEPAVNSKNNTGDWKIGKYLIENKKNHGDKYTIIPKFATELTKKDLKILGGPPDCLYVDCEGCLLGFLKSDIGKFVLKSLRFVVNEMDGNNDEIDKILKKNGFKLKHVGYGCGKSCYTNVYQR